MTPLDSIFATFQQQADQALNDAVAAQAALDAQAILELQNRLATANQLIASLQTQIAADQAEEAAEDWSANLKPLTTANQWSDQTLHSGSPQPSSHTPTISPDQSAVSITLSGGAFAGTLYTRKFGPQPAITKVSYQMTRQSGPNVNAWESDIEVIRIGKKWNGSFQLRFDTGLVQIWHGTWVNTPVKHGVDPTKTTQVEVRFEIRPEGMFYKSVLINGTEMPIGVLMPLENTTWGDNLIAQVQEEIDGHGGSLTDSISGIQVLAA